MFILTLLMKHLVCQIVVKINIHSFINVSVCLDFSLEILLLICVRCSQPGFDDTLCLAETCGKVNTLALQYIKLFHTNGIYKWHPYNTLCIMYAYFKWRVGRCYIPKKQMMNIFKMSLFMPANNRVHL